MVIYVALRYAIAQTCRMCKRHVEELDVLAVTFDSATFAGSLLLFLGIYRPQVLHAIGETKPYLLIAAIAGIIFTLKGLRPPKL